MASIKNNIIDDKGVRIFLELGTSLQLEVKETALSLKSEMVGMEVDKYLIAKVYQMSDEQKDLIKKNEVIVKYLHKNSVFGFQSNIISIISEPESIVFLEYPKEINNYEVRANKRIPCFLPAKLEIEYNTVEGVIVDINTTGCCCVIKDFKILSEQTLDNVTIHLQNSKLEYDFTMLGKVRSIRHNKDELYIGIIFVKIDGNTQSAIQAIIPTLKFGNETTV